MELSTTEFECEYVYYACGETVDPVRCQSNEAAWDYVRTHGGYDCVVEQLK